MAMGRRGRRQRQKDLWVAAVAVDEQANEKMAPAGIEEVVADKGYHSNEVLTDLTALQIRSYVSEPDRGRRRWRGKSQAREAVYANRRRIRGTRGQRLLRWRAERVERSFAHLYDSGGMRRTHLRGRKNVLKRLLIHVGGKEGHFRADEEVLGQEKKSGEEGWLVPGLWTWADEVQRSTDNVV